LLASLWQVASQPKASRYREQVLFLNKNKTSAILVAPQPLPGDCLGLNKGEPSPKASHLGLLSFNKKKPSSGESY
jgi:hypothetical protein